MKKKPKDIGNKAVEELRRARRSIRRGEWQQSLQQTIKAVFFAGVASKLSPHKAGRVKRISLKHAEKLVTQRIPDKAKVHCLTQITPTKALAPDAFIYNRLQEVHLCEQQNCAQCKLIIADLIARL